MLKYTGPWQNMLDGIGHPWPGCTIALGVQVSETELIGQKLDPVVGIIQSRVSSQHRELRGMYCRCS